jgi:hypothetical protein
MPEGFNLSHARDTDMDWDEPELEQRPEALSPFQSTDSAHGASGLDDEESVDHTARAYQEQSDQIVVCYPVEPNDLPLVYTCTSAPTRTRTRTSLT